MARFLGEVFWTRCRRCVCVGDKLDKVVITALIQRGSTNRETHGFITTALQLIHSLWAFRICRLDLAVADEVLRRYYAARTNCLDVLHLVCHGNTIFRRLLR